MNVGAHILLLLLHGYFFSLCSFVLKGLVIRFFFLFYFILYIRLLQCNEHLVVQKLYDECRTHIWLLLLSIAWTFFFLLVLLFGITYDIHTLFAGWA